MSTESLELRSEVSTKRRNFKNSITLKNGPRGHDRCLRVMLYSSIGTLASLDDISYRIRLDNSQWNSENRRPTPITWRPGVSPQKTHTSWEGPMLLYLPALSCVLELGFLVCACCLLFPPGPSRVLPWCCWGRKRVYSCACLCPTYEGSLS
eukprot:1143979-Pelagomonas_calceolata.AAC.2